jgi:hypothetical protein
VKQLTKYGFVELGVRSELRDEAADRQEEKTDAEGEKNREGPVAYMHKHLNVVEVNYANGSDHAVSGHIVLLTVFVHDPLREVENHENTEASEQRVNIEDQHPYDESFAVAHGAAKLVVLRHRHLKVSFFLNGSIVCHTHVLVVNSDEEVKHCGHEDVERDVHHSFDSLESGKPVDPLERVVVC